MQGIEFVLGELKQNYILLVDILLVAFLRGIGLAFANSHSPVIETLKSDRVRPNHETVRIIVRVGLF